MLINDFMTIATLSINSLEPVATDTTLSGRDVVTKTSNQKFEFTATTTPMLEAGYMALFAQLTALSGAYGTFQLKLPIGQGNPDKTDVSATAIVAAGQSVVPIAVHGQILSGTLIKFGGHSKVYTILSHVSNQVTLYPALTAPVANGEAGVIDQPIITVRKSGDMAPIGITQGLISQPYDITFIEVI